MPSDANKSTPAGVVPMNSASSRQVGGDHYKRFAIEPAEFLHRNGIGYLEGAAIKYILRRKHNRREDLEKAIHCVQLMLEYEFGSASQASERGHS